MPFKFLIATLLLFFSSFVFSQPMVELKGKVVSVADGSAKGISNVRVRVVGESYDFTKDDGSFSLHVPSNKEFVTIFLEDCPHPMISPYQGRVNIPPTGLLMVKVCAKENQKLRKKVDELNQKLSQVERQHRLTKRQMAEMHDQMLAKIVDLQLEMEALQKELQSTSESLDKANQKLAELERKNAELEQQLLEALESKYLRQKKVFDEIAAELEQYIDQSKNLRDNMLPERIRNYFSTNAGARERLYDSIEKYNAARQLILDNHKNRVLSVSNYWDAYELSDELEVVYKYLLDDVHKQGIYPMDFSVTDNLRAFLNRATSSTKARKAAEEGAGNAIPKLDPMIASLEKQSDEILYKLKNNL